MSVSEDRESPASAREIRVKCDACGDQAYGQIPWNPTAMQRNAIMHDIVAQHRRVCRAGNTEDKRTYEIWYPRK